MAKMSELDSDRQRIERLTDVVRPPSFAESAQAGMPAHTPTPWILEGTSVYYLDWDGASYEGRGKDYRQQLTNRFWFSVQGSPKRIPKEELEANAAFIVKAVNNHDELVRRLIEATKAIEAGNVILAKLMDAESALNAVVAAKMPGEARRIAHEALQKIAGCA